MPVYPFSDVNGRMFYACMGVLYKSRNSQDGSDSPTDGSFLTGVQSVGVSSDFPSASLMDVGRAKRKFHYYAPQSFEITIERVIDQSSNFFYYVDDSDYTADAAGAKSCHILNSNNIGATGILDSGGKCLRSYDITILYGRDIEDRIGEGSNVFQVTYRNCLVTSISYSMETQGSVTESITLITRGATYNESTSTGSYTLPGSDRSGTTIQRQHLDFLHEGASWGTRYSVLPEEVETMFLAKDSSGDDPSEPGGDEAMRILGINSIGIDITIEYSELADIGKRSGLGDQGKQNLWRYVTLPVQVTSSFSGTLRQPLPKTAAQFPAGTYLPNTDTTFSAANGATGSDDWNKVNREIRLVAKMSTSPSPSYFVWDLGQRNYLTSLSYDGGGADGGNLEATMSYQNDESDAVLVKDTSVRDLPNVLF
jgi:hypothetical protein